MSKNEAELIRLRTENDMLKGLLAKHGIAIPSRVVIADSAAVVVRPVSTVLSPEAKVKLFRRLFHGRNDVYPIRWQSPKTGKAGYSPVCANEWHHGPEVSASIIGHIRQAALGEALLPFEQRVANAMQRIYALTNWTPVQRKWLGRLASQFTHEVVLDQQFVNHRFNADGGAKQLNVMLDGQLEQVLTTFAGALWPQAA